MESPCFPDKNCLFKSVPIPKVDFLLMKKIEAVQKLKVMLSLKYRFKTSFQNIVKATLCKYNSQKDGTWIPKRFRTHITIAEARPLDPDRILIQRRMASLNDTTVQGIEEIIIDRKTHRIQMFLHQGNALQIQERCSYHDQASQGVSYELNSFTLQWGKILRTKVFKWGVSKLENVIQEIEKDTPKPTPSQDKS